MFLGHAIIGPLTSAPNFMYIFVEGFNSFPFVIVVVLPAIICSFIAYLIAKIDDVKIRRVVVGCLIGFILFFMAFYLPTVY